LINTGDVPLIAHTSRSTLPRLSRSINVKKIPKELWDFKTELNKGITTSDTDPMT